MNPEELKALLLRWYREDDWIADEMTWTQIQTRHERYQELLTIGIDPYEYPLTSD